MTSAQNPPTLLGMNSERRWVIVLLAIALATRLLWISVPLNVDEQWWITRGAAFMQALLEGRPTETYVRHHPGVTNMWLTGGTLTLRYLLRGTLPPGDLASNSTSLVDYLKTVSDAEVVPLELFVQARIASAFVTAVCMLGFYVFSRRLFGPVIATIAAIILLFEPFFLAYQRFLTTDANQTNFTWLALLAFLLYLRGVRDQQARALHWSALSGIFFGLAVLSKVSALLSLPAFALAAIWWTWTSKSRSARFRLLRGVLLWALAATAIAFLLWPALWADLRGTVTRLLTAVGGEIDGHLQFFLGQVVGNPSVAFYPVVLVYRVSPLLLLGSVLGLASLVSARLRRHLHEPACLTVIVVDIAVVLIAVSSLDSKLDRYIIPIVPGMALLAASGIWAVAGRIRETRAWSAPGEDLPLLARALRPGGLLSLVLLAQLATLLPHVPYYITYFNPFAGGPVQAQRLLMVGNGELLDQAGAWLRQQAPKKDAVVAVLYAKSLGPYYGGPTIQFSLVPGNIRQEWAFANFVVVYINGAQRNFPEQIMEYFGFQRPLYEVKAHGLNYVQVYPGPLVRDTDLAKVPNRVDLDFEGEARLIGYDLETPEVPAGQPGVLALYWQALDPFPAPDFTVHVGIKDADGNVWGEADSAPVGAMLPVDQWQAGQIVRDAHQMTVPPGTPPGEYDLEVSFWSPTLQKALEIRDGNTPLGRDAALTKLRVSQPTKAPELAADLQIANRVEGEVRVAPGAARLVGYQWSRPTSARAGDAIPLVLLWQAGTHESADVQLRLRLSQGLTQQWQRAAGHPLGGNYAPANWTPGQLVRDTWNALLPPDAPAGRYQLELMAQTPTGNEVLLDLGSIDLSARHHSFDEPRPQFSQEASLRSSAPSAGGNIARLLGYGLPDMVQLGQVLPVTLYWEALGEAERNYVRFVHVLDANDRIVAQQDGVPGDGDMPLTSWQVGEYVQDDLAISIPHDVPPGRYRLAVGMYDPANGERLTTPDGQREVILSRDIEAR